ncbi:Hypothetical predicted protein [Mytilus galloprovincialis]|nr:Hypothetical predicted protein [Mytilus galloprovincialis]
MVAKQVFQRLMIIGVFDVIFACSLLICGIVAAIYGNDDDDYRGLPYFYGSFITGVFFLLKGMLYIKLYKKQTSGGPSVDKLVSCIPVILMFGFMMCFAGIVILSISGVYLRCYHHSDLACSSNIGKYRSVAIPIMILVILCAILNIYTGLFLCKKRQQLEQSRMVNITTQQGSRNNQMAIIHNQNVMQLITDQQTGYLAGQNYSGVHMESSSNSRPADPTGCRLSAYSRDLAVGYLMGSTASYSMGPGIPLPEQQFPEPNPQPKASYPSGPTGLSSDVKIDLNQTPEEPSAPPPSYESVTKQ